MSSRYHPAMPVSSTADASPPAKLYELYRERIVQFRAQPPGTDWDGIYTFTTK
jgi:adenylate cyclase